jgi:hypothetical protein
MPMNAQGPPARAGRLRSLEEISHGLNGLNGLNPPQIVVAVEMHKDVGRDPTCPYIMQKQKAVQKAVIDGSNAAYLKAPRERKPNISNISEVARAVERSGLVPIIIIDPDMRSLMVDVAEFERLLSDPRTMSLPPGKDFGRFVLEVADNVNAVIVSNYTYAEYYEDYPWIEDRRIPVAIVNSSVMLLSEKLRRAS